ncbi:MAG: isoleucine--tRNA ligase [Butyrivibrio sp.]|nr:isoleucine--tRNA ligase [Butyrivibrio sp.]
MYRKVDTDMGFTSREHEVEQFWKDTNTFEESERIREGQPLYMFYDGPPTANGKPHIGHVLTRAIKDMIPRYRTMKGYQVPRKAGWDTHGLPVELEVEKALGIEGKEQIEEYGIEPFIKKCKESVWQYKGMWEDFSGTVGFWADMDHPYITYEDDYIESEWWALKEIWDKGLLYKGFKVVPYCPRCGTPLSSHEVAQGYKVLKERSAVVRFKVKGEDAYFLAWTTTPWTLPSNIALCVNPEETYVKVKAVDGNVYYLAQALADNVLSALLQAKKGEEAPKGPAYEVLETFVGKDLEYKEYEPLYECAAQETERQHKKAFFIYCDGYVTMSDGTGIVHIAPAFGEDDARVGRKYDAPLVQMVDSEGKLKAETPFAGMRCKPTQKEMDEGAVSADPEVLKDLDKRGLLFSAPKLEHDYPHCWRCDTPLLYYARSSWFIKVTEVREDMIRNNQEINWIPPTIGKGRFGDWLENIQDWGISRDRYWGTPLNVWECPDCGAQTAIGSRQELADRSGDASALNTELHRPYIDRFEIKCEKCGGAMHRVKEVIDCWFDSGAMPFAQLHYPFENKELFEKEFPAQFISEAVDQTRGWFYSLHAEATLLFNKPAFKNVIVLGLVQDENGQKMSKSKGNAVDPFEALATYGADAIRWYFYTNSAPWLPSRFAGKTVLEGQRKFLSTLWNSYSFFVLYANIDGFDAAEHELVREDLTTMDRWILSRLNTMIGEVDRRLDAYQIPEAGKALDAFVDELSNWYVRRCRERFWAPGLEADKVAAYMTLYTALVQTAKAAAPMVPFITEAIYQNLVRGGDRAFKPAEAGEQVPASIHLCDFPAADASFIDASLEKSMDMVLDVVVLGRAARNAAAVKNRQPIAQMLVKSEDTLEEAYQEIIRDELNVKSVEFTSDVRGLTDYTFKPQLKTVGPKYGKVLGGIKAHLSALDGNAAMDELNSSGALRFEVDGTAVELIREDLLIETAQREGYQSAEDGRFTVVLDTKLTPELIEEGYFYEVISKLQTMRKDAGFEVMDRITVGMSGSDRVLAVVRARDEALRTKVLADEITTGEALEEGAVEGSMLTKDWDINGEQIRIRVTRVTA